MAFIVESIVGDRRIQIANEEFIRRMTIGTLWSKIRIGVRLCMNGGSGVTSNQGFQIGICQGANGFMSGSTVDYMGVQYGANTPLNSATLTFTAGPPAYYQASVSSLILIKKAGTTNTVANGAASGIYFSAAPTTNHSQVFLDITKASPSYTVTGWCAGSIANVQTDISASTFLTNMENEAGPTSVISNVNTLAYSGNALFDTISLFWLRSIPTVEISDLAVCRFL